MALNVAQLNILVGMDVSGAQAAAAALGQTLGSIGPQTQAAASAADASLEAILAELESIGTTGVEAVLETKAAFLDLQASVNLNTQAVLTTGAATVAAMSQARASVQQVTTQAQTMTESIATGMRNAGTGIAGTTLLFSAMGQQLSGPVVSALLLVGLYLRTIPADASAATLAVSGLAAALTALGALGIAANASLQTANARLATSFHDVGTSVADYTAQIEDAESHGRDMGFTNAQTANSLATLATATGSATLALKDEQVAEDLARYAHESLDTATKQLAGSYNGFARGVRQLGPALAQLASEHSNVVAAQKAEADAATTLTNAQDRLQQVTQKYNDRLAEQALAVDQVKRAHDNLILAQQSLADLQQSQAAQALETMTNDSEALQSAQENLGRAVERVNELQQQQAAQLAEAQEAANQRLGDSMASAAVNAQKLQDELMKLGFTASSAANIHDALEKATNKVVSAQVALGDATGGQIQPAQDALNGALETQRELLLSIGSSAGLTVAQFQSLMDAQDAVTKSLLDEARAKEKVNEVTDPHSSQNIAAAQQAANANTSVADAQTKVNEAIEKLAALDDPNSPANLQKAKQMESAQKAVADAVQAVAQANNNAQSEALKNRDAYLAVQNAQRTVTEDQGKLVDSQKNLNDALTRGQNIIDAIGKAVKDQSDAYSKTWKGAFDRFMADFNNWLTGFGGGVGKFGVLAIPLFFVGGKLWKLFSKGGGAEAGAGEAGGLEAEVASAGTAAEGAVPGLEAAAAAAGTEGLAGALGAIALPAAAGAAATAALAAGLHYLTGEKWGDAFKHSIAPLTEWIDQAPALTSKLKGAWDQAQLDFGKWGDEIGKKARDTWDTMNHDVDNAWGTITSKLKSAEDRVTHDAESWAKGFGSTVKRGWDETFKDVGQWGSQIESGIESGFANAGSTLENTGRDLVTGLYNGFVDEYNSVKNDLGQVGQGIVDLYHSVFGQHSPSVVFEEMGRNNMRGLYIGQTDEWNNLIAPFITKAQADAQVKLVQPGQFLGYGGLNGLAPGASIGGGAQNVQFNLTVPISVAGHVTTSRDLSVEVRDQLVNLGAQNGGLARYLGINS